MKQIYFFGSGASVGAGYPPTQELLNKIKNKVQSADQRTKEAWDRFEKFRYSAKGQLKLVLESSNPELMLTVPDLLAATLKENDLDTWKKLKEARRSDDQRTIREINKWWRHPLRKQLVAGEQAKRDFQLLVDHFFSMKHADDDQPTAMKRRTYIRKAMTNLSEGDVVITTNWDTIVERTLMEQKKWLPGDGYGFTVGIESGPAWLPSQPLPDDLTKPSQVKVLKLHGSIGWFSCDNNEIYFRDPNYLQYLRPNEKVIRGKKAPNFGPHENFVLVGFSYLKSLEGRDIQSIWDQASEAIATANEVTIVGYSLPSADVAVRMLLNPLRRRIFEGLVKVKVVDTNKTTLKRWKTFLEDEDEDKVETIQKEAEKFFGND